MNDLDDLGICNAASTLIGAGKLKSITEPTNDKEAVFQTLYLPLLKHLISQFDWSHEEDERQLSVDADKPPLYGYLYSYLLPTDMITGPLAVYPGEGKTFRTILKYRVAAGYLYSDEPEVWITGTFNLDISLWPPSFVQLVIHALAAQAAKPVADNDDLGTSMRIKAFGTDNELGQGGLFRECKAVVGKTRPIRSIFRNGDPLTVTRR